MVSVRQSLLLLSVLISSSLTTEAKVIGGAIIPHGDFAFDPSLVNSSSSALLLHEACVNLGEKISDLKPDIILLSTPHGVALDIDFAIYGNTHLGDTRQLERILMIQLMRIIMLN